MKRPAIAKDKAHAMRRWVFRWQGLDGSPFRGLLAIVITAGIFMLFAATVKIRVSAPQQWVERKASIIHLPSDGDGKIWALRAQEGGPFPSRVNPSVWEKLAGVDAVMARATGSPSTPYQPTLRDLPADEQTSRPTIADKNERVFPDAPAKTVPAPATVEMRLVPEIYPLSGVLFEGIPAELPPFEAPVDAAMTSGSWRFLLRLRPDGGVSECVPLSDEPGGSPLAKWLRGVTFSPETAKKSEWIGVGVFFTNQPVHGPDAR